VSGVLIPLEVPSDIDDVRDELELSASGLMALFSSFMCR